MFRLHQSVQITIINFKTNRLRFYFRQQYLKNGPVCSGTDTKPINYLKTA